MKKSRLWLLLLAILAIILWGAQWALNGPKDAIDKAADTVWELAEEVGEEVWELGEDIEEIIEWDDEDTNENDDDLDEENGADEDSDEDAEGEAENEEDRESEDGENEGEDDEGEGDADTQEPTDGISIDLESSSVKWTWRAGPKSHEGIVNIQSADLEFTDGKVSGGEIMMDMSSIKVTDTDSQWLLDHLNAEDYFDTATYPVAKLDITETTDDTITGDLSIKDKTFPVTFKYTMGDGLIESSFGIDSTRWGVAADGVAGALISDNVDLEINLAY